MKIVYNDTRTVAFKTIAVGDIFSSYDSLYMRTVVDNFLQYGIIYFVLMTTTQRK